MRVLKNSLEILLTVPSKIITSQFLTVLQNCASNSLKHEPGARAQSQRPCLERTMPWSSPQITAGRGES